MDLEDTENFGKLYWMFNCPLQMWPRYLGDSETSPIINWRVLNYMPRKERCMDLEQYVDPNELKPYCDNAAKILRNLANLFEKLGNREIDLIYYPELISRAY